MSIEIVTPFNSSLGRKVYSSRFLPGQCEVCQHLNFVRGVLLMNDELEELRLSASNGCAMCSVLRGAVAFHLPLGAELLIVLSHGKRKSRYEHFKMKYSVPGNDEYQAKEFELFRSIEVEPGDFEESLVQRYRDTTHLGPGREISTTTASDESMKWLKMQIESCTTGHQACSEAAKVPKTMPSRLLHLSKNSTFSVQLVDKSPAVKDYVCLSHCWGPKPLIRTLKSNIAQFTEEIPWNSIPKTFQDVISVTHALGLEYLWIDSLCIVQDDAEDWNIESANMAGIYQGAYITIAATGAHDSSQGLFFETASKHHSHELIPESSQPQPFKVYTRQPLYHFHSFHKHAELAVQFPLLSRAWCYQERLLSSRVIHFTRNELIWECLQETACECSGTTTSTIDADAQSKITHDSALTKSPDEDRTRRAEWCSMIESFSKLNLTYASDLLPALSGAAKQMQALSRDAYLAGLWKSTFFADLLWQCSMVVGRSGSTVRTKDWRAPMFSWGSVEGKVEYPYPVAVYTPMCFSDIPEGHKAGEHEEKWAGTLNSECEIVEFEYVPATSDPTGKLEKASVTVRGPVVLLRLWGGLRKVEGGSGKMEYVIQTFPPAKQIAKEEARQDEDTEAESTTTTIPSKEDIPGVEDGAEAPTLPEMENLDLSEPADGQTIGNFFPDWDLTESGPYWAATFPGMNVYCLLVGEDTKLTHQRAVVFGGTSRGFERLGVLWYEGYREMLKMAEMKIMKLI